MLASRFIYDLAGLPRPEVEHLDEEIDRLLYILTAEEPDYMVPPETRDQLANLDSEILSLWLTKKFKTALILLILGERDNYVISKRELLEMERFKINWVNRFLRPSFLQKRALEQVDEVYFADTEVPSLQHATTDLKRTLTFISNHLQTESPEYKTLLNTERYTFADKTFYSFLKRIVVGNFKNFGLSAHVKLCSPLINFMKRYAEKNARIIDVSGGDPLASPEESSLIGDAVKPAVVCLAVIIFFLWSRRN